MNKVVLGQSSIILCCVFYLIWWSRCYRPGVTVNRIGGVNGLLLLITATLGVAGVLLSLRPIPEVREHIIPPHVTLIAGVIGYFVLLVITRFLFERIVTTELVLITGWTALEFTVIDRLYAAGCLERPGFTAESIVIAAAFLISMILYVAYYRMDQNLAFYAAMVPLVTEGVAMGVLVFMLL